MTFLKNTLFTLVVVLVFFRHSGCPDTKGSDIPDTVDRDSLTLLFTGDIMQHDGQISSAYDPATGTYRYDSCFQYISETISSADWAIANLEVTLGGQPYTGYPQFSAPDSLAPALKRAGFDVLVTANNHSCDRRGKGIVRTLDVLDSLDIVHTGTFRDQSERDSLYPLILEKNGIILGLLNYTYGTNGIPVPKPGMVNLIDTFLIRKDYEKARKKGVDEVIVFFHWGTEYLRLPDENQKALADFCHRLGIRFVIGSHPHVIQPMEACRDTLGNITDITVYSLGNFISNQRQRFRDGGVVFMMTLSREQDTIRVTNPGYKLTWVHTCSHAGKVNFRILPVHSDEKKAGFFSPQDSLKFVRFIEDSRVHLNTKNINVPEFQYNKTRTSGQ